MFGVASLTEAFCPFELPFWVTKLIEKGKRFKPSTSLDNIATFVLDFLEIVLVIYFIGFL